MRLIADMIAFTVDEVPQVEPDQHLQLPPAGGGRDAGPGDRVRAVHRDRRARRGPRAGAGRRPSRGCSGASRSSSTPASASSRSTRSCARWASSGRRSAASATASTTTKFLRMRYGVQVNSLGLTEAQPENNVIRIVLEALAVTMGRDARARALQLPAWNEALGLPRPWDQQWSLRIQQILAYETDMLDYPDIFEGSKVMDGLVAELVDGARAEMAIVGEHGGAVEAVPYMKTQLVESHRARVGAIESGEQKVIGQNVFTETEPSPLQEGEDGGILTVDPAVEQERHRSRRWNLALAARRTPRSTTALEDLREAAATRRERHARARSPPPRPARPPASGRRRCASVFGEYRGPTGVGDAAAAPADDALAALRDRVERVVRGARPAGEDPGRQARPRRPFQRRRADRRAGPRRRHGRGLRGHPADPGADRATARPGGRPRGRPLDPVRLARRADPRRARASSRRPGVDVPVVVGGIIPKADEAPDARQPASRGSTRRRTSRCRDHGRHRRPRGRAQRRRRRRSARRQRRTARTALHPGASRLRAPSRSSLAISRRFVPRAPRDRASLRSLRRRQHGRRASAQLEAVGLTAAAGASWIRPQAGRLHRIHRGGYAVGHRRLTGRGRSWPPCGVGSSAAVVVGPPPERSSALRPDDRAVDRESPCLTRRSGSREGRGSLTRLRHAPAGDVTHRHGIPCTTVARTPPRPRRTCAARAARARRSSRP